MTREREITGTGWSDAVAAAVLSSDADTEKLRQYNETAGSLFSETRIYDGGVWVVVDDATGDIAQWSNSASDVRYWFMRERRGLPAADFDNDSVREAQEICAQSVDVLLPAGQRSQYHNYPETVLRYTLDGVITSADDVGSTQDEMDFAWQGQVINVGGAFHFKPGSERTPVRTLNVQREAISIDSATVFPEIGELINELSCTLESSGGSRLDDLSALSHC